MLGLVEVLVWVLLGCLLVGLLFVLSVAAIIERSASSSKNYVATLCATR